MEKLSKKKKKNAPPVTEKTLEESKANVIEPGPAKPEPEQPVSSPLSERPLTTDERLARLEADMKQAETMFQSIGGYIVKIDKVINELPQMLAQKQGGEQEQVVLGLAERLMGGNSNPLGEKMDKLVGAMLDKGFQNIMNPPKSLLEEALEKQIAEKTAKKIAESL